MFDLSINLGNLLTIFAFLCGGLSFVFMMRNMISSLNYRMGLMEETNKMLSQDIKKLQDILVTLGKYEERFLRVEGMIDDLRHGRGIIS